MLESPLGDLIAPGRRRFLQLGASVLAGAALPVAAWGADFWSQPRELWLTRPATGETVKTVYWANGELVAPNYIALCRLLRDTHLNIAVQMDPVTLDILRGVYGWLRYFGIDRPLVVLSGYRHPRTNANIEGAALRSLHMLGQAVDIAIEGVSSTQVGRLGQYLSAGGVGFYPTRNFTHLDRGRLRSWTG